MGYFQDIMDIFLMKEDTYKKLGNDTKTFGRFFKSYLLSSYLVYIFFALIGGLAMLIFMPAAMILKPEILFLALIICVGVILILPFICFGLSYIFTLIPYVIGLMFGGKPKKYSDFYKIFHFTKPVQLPLMALFNEVANPVFAVWNFFILHKTYKIIHKMNSSQATLAVVTYLVLSLFVVVALVLVIISIYVPLMALASSPQYMFM